MLGSAIKGIPNKDYAASVLPMLVIFLLGGVAACTEKDRPPVASGATAAAMAADTLPTDQPLSPVTPAAGWALYRDPVLGFSLEYPTNWRVEGADPPQSPTDPQGTSVRIRNYNDAVRKDGFIPDQLSIDIVVLPELAQYGTLDNWVVQRPLYQDAVYGPRKEITVSNLRALSWDVTGPTAPDGVILIALAPGKWIYLISAYPATSKHLATFDTVISSLRIP
jgi:hypothetical protein